MKDILKDNNWSNWKLFPDPRRKDYLSAPFGFGVYQLYNKKTKEYVLFGRGKNLAFRITTMLPKPLGQGTRNNNNKKTYVLKNIEHIQYRTIPLENEKQCRNLEKNLKALNIHIFNENKE